MGTVPFPFENKKKFRRQAFEQSCETEDLINLDAVKFDRDVIYFSFYKEHGNKHTNC